VKFNLTYYRLIDPRVWPEEGVDSTVAFGSINNQPDLGDPWVFAATVEDTIVGKVFVYKRNANNVYQLKQTITADALASISDIAESISSGDKFGYSLAIDQLGATLIISSPEADNKFQNQGSVFVLTCVDTSTPEYRLKQKIQSFENYSNEAFGSSISITEYGERIVVGAKNTPYRLSARFDISLSGTTFDGNTTTFSSDQGFTGEVYVFEKKNDVYLLSEKLEPNLLASEGFGSSVSCYGSTIVVGSPNYTITQTVSAGSLVAGNVYTIKTLGTTDFTLVGAADNEVNTNFTATGNGTGTGTVNIVATKGMTRLFRKDSNIDSWKTIAVQPLQVDLTRLKSIALYDEQNNIRIADVDTIDHAKLKILGIAEQEIYFKTPYDPATYTNGTEDQVVDVDQAWFEKNVGRLWWNIETAKWINYEQNDISYRAGNWNQLASGASIDVYEWVESVLLPSEWSALADTNEGLAEGISGQPFAIDDTVFSVKEFYNSTTGQISGTKYYYWVKNKAVLPENSLGRKRPASDVAALISNPINSGLPIIALVDSDKFIAYNFEQYITEETALVNIQYYRSKNSTNLVHNEYQLLTEGVANSLPTAQLEAKWIDSLAGYDKSGNVLPDPKLPAKQKYGIRFRPRQSMFVNKNKILTITIDKINGILATRPFADLIDFTNLNLTDPLPSNKLNQYDVSVDAYIDLQNVGTARVKQAVLRANIVNAEIDTIDIIDPGFGYKVVPPILIEGTGTGATATVTIDKQGKISSVTVTGRGKKYNSASVLIRNFSVLVNNDETANGFWSIYAWDGVRKGFFRSKSQGFDTPRYWDYTDWYADGYTITTRIVKEIGNLYEEPTLTLNPGDIIRVKEYGQGGWALLLRTQPGEGTILENYLLVARQAGTIKINYTLYSSTTKTLGYDGTATYDIDAYDLLPTLELRNILRAVKEDVFKDELAVEWNNLFFTAIRYVFSEQSYVDWAFKTSFLNATHNIGDLEQKTNYKNDNLENYQQYLEEVKPYRTTIREYTSRYTDIDRAGAATTDFDLPPAYSVSNGTILPINEYYNLKDQYPWKSWADNNGYEITEIVVSNQGAGYTSPPAVMIVGNGIGATAQAYISNGKVSGIVVTNSGIGYTLTPIVYLVGGNGSNINIASAVAILGNSCVRSFDLTMKFDRLAKTGTYSSFNQTETIIASGTTSVIDLKYPPTQNKGKITITKNNQIILGDEYSISLYVSSIGTYSLLKGKLQFTTTPAKGDIISITYEKNDALLDSINRIEKYYAPVDGMKGVELNQLMTGIDFGGVQIQGTTFDVSGGWDALPWFTDSWDSVDSNSDFYYVTDSETYNDTIKYSPGAMVWFGNKHYTALLSNTGVSPIGNPHTWEEFKSVTLPYVPAAGQAISIYIKPASFARRGSIDTLGDSTAPTVVVDPGVNEPKAVRIDDFFYNLYDGVTIQPNGRTSAPPTVLMNTYIGDGSSSEIVLAGYVTLLPGDTVICRTFESDGSVIINDVNLIDTNITGGLLSGSQGNTLIAPNTVSGAYSTAIGITAEEISLDGDKFISPDQVPAPEENVPGQVLESVSIKVYNTSLSGAAPLNLRLAFANNSALYDIGIKILEPMSVKVYVNKIEQEYSVDYDILFDSNQIRFLTLPVTNALIEIISIGLGGVAILDYQEFIADGTTNYFLTKARYLDTQSVVVTVNGERIDTGFINSSSVTTTTDRTLVAFGDKPELGKVIKIVCLGAALDSDSSGEALVRANQQAITYTGVTRQFDLDSFVSLTRASARSAIQVDVNGHQLIGVDTIYQVYNGTNNKIIVGVDPVETIGTITSNNIQVFVNNELQPFVLAYTYDGNQNLIDVNTSVLNIGDIIKVEVNLRTQYSVGDNSITITDDVSLTPGDVINVTWFSEYPTLDIVSDQYTGGKAHYKLTRTPVNIGYVWVYKNGVRLTGDQDYSVSLERSLVYLKDETTTADSIKIVQFGNSLQKLPSAYEVFKDMLNIYHFKRFSANKNINLAKELNYYDLQLEVTDSSSLFEPVASRNIPGVVTINNERIEYLKKTGNILSQLRRGSLGTPISPVHAVSSLVVDVSISESIPYTETQQKFTFISDGSSKMIGPLEFIPKVAFGTTDLTWYRDSVTDAVTKEVEYNPPLGNGRCDEIEVFVSGRRLRKTPIGVYTEDNGVTSPEADEQIPAEFSVDGATGYVRLTAPLAAGSQITVIRRLGSTWHNRGETTATTGVTLLDNTTPIAVFLSQKATELPE